MVQDSFIDVTKDIEIEALSLISLIPRAAKASPFPFRDGRDASCTCLCKRPRTYSDPSYPLDQSHKPEIPLTPAFVSHPSERHSNNGPLRARYQVFICRKHLHTLRPKVTPTPPRPNHHCLLTARPASTAPLSKSNSTTAPNSPSTKTSSSNLPTSPKP